MKRLKTRYLLLLAIPVVLIAAVLLYRFSRNIVNDLVDAELLDSVRAELTEQIPEGADAETIRTGLEANLTAHGVEFSTDDSSNLIVRRKASEGSEGARTTVYCVNIESGSFPKDLTAVSTALYMAACGQEGPAYTIAFLNNEDNLMAGAKGIRASLFPQDAWIICLSGGSFGLSTDSFASMNTRFLIPYEESDRVCDTGIRIKIGGITAGIPGPSISDQPNPITQLSGIMTRLKTKSIRYQIADIHMENSGNLYPTDIEITLLVNSYSLQNVTKYLDKRAEDFTEKYSKNHPEISYIYEVIEDTETLPDKAYDDQTTDSLMNLLYTVKNGTYRFKEGEAPEGYKEKEIYAVNCLEELRVNDDDLECRLYSEALNSLYLDQIIADNAAAAELSDAVSSAYNIAPEFKNGGSILAERFTFLYPAVNELSAKSSIVPLEYDTGSTCCSYLASKGKDTDAIHLSVDENSQYYVINTFLNMMPAQD